MNLLQALVLGVVQGITEFLPISSTAHLILVPRLLGWTLDPESIFVFDVLLQLGTVLSVVIYFRKDLLAILKAVWIGLASRQPLATSEARLGWWIVVATAPAAVIGLPLKPYFESLHHMPVVVAVILMAAALLIFVSERLGRRNRALSELRWIDALLIGCSQALALFPGVSRSAATICGGLVRGLERGAAARFSFLMSVPALTAASVVALKDLLELPGYERHLPPLLVGTVVALFVGLASIHWLLSWLARHPMYAFGWYRLIAGAVFLGALLLGN